MAMEPVDQRHPARPRPRAAGHRLPGRGDLGRLRRAARPAPPPRLGQHRRRRPDQHHRRLLPPLASTRSAASSATTSTAGFAGMKFKVGGKTPAEDAARVRVAREAAGPDFALMVDANQGYDRAQAVEFARLVWDLDIRWFEEPCRWTNDARWMRDVRYQTGIPVCAGQSETTLAGHPRPHRRPARSTSPTSTRRGPAARRSGARRPGWPPRSVSSSATTRSRRSRRTCWPACPDHTFVECFDEERDPFFWRLSDMSTRIAAAATRCPSGPASASSSTGTTSGAHTVATRSTDRSTIA